MVTARFLANFDKKHIRKNYDVTNDVIIIRNKSDENGLYQEREFRETLQNFLFLQQKKTT